MTELGAIAACDTAAQARLLEIIPPVLRRHGVADRCELHAGSFFDSVPARGDVYLPKSVLHDWDDVHSARLLGRCHQVMQPEACLVVVERLRPQRLGATAYDRAVARSDLNMLVGLAGRERSLAEYRALFQAAGFELHDVRDLTAGFSAMRLAQTTTQG